MKAQVTKQGRASHASAAIASSREALFLGGAAAVLAVRAAALLAELATDVLRAAVSAPPADEPAAQTIEAEGVCPYAASVEPPPPSSLRLVDDGPRSSRPAPLSQRSIERARLLAMA
jgi:hypothetical protein